MRVMVTRMIHNSSNNHDANAQHSYGSNQQAHVTTEADAHSFNGLTCLQYTLCCTGSQ